MEMYVSAEMKRHHLLLTFSFIIAISMLSVSAFADDIYSIKLLKISARDEKAVIKTPEGKMQIIRIGDMLPVSGPMVLDPRSELETATPGPGDLKCVMKVTEITTGRVVLEATDASKETIIIRLENGKQNIERIRKTPGDKPVLYKTQ